MRITLIIGLTAGAFASPVIAQDTPAPMSGFHVEGLVGYDSSEIEDDDDGGVVYGARAGYDFQTGRFVLGVEGEASDSSNNGCATDIIAINDSICARAGRDLSIGGRAGVVVGRRVLLYGTAGYTNARFRVDYDDGTVAGTNNLSYTTDLDGVRVGAGAQFGVGSNAYLRTEFRYSNYEGGSDRGQVIGAFGFRF